MNVLQCELRHNNVLSLIAILLSLLFIMINLLPFLFLLILQRFYGWFLHFGLENENTDEC